MRSARPRPRRPSLTPYLLPLLIPPGAREARKRTRTGHHARLPPVHVWHTDFFFPPLLLTFSLRAHLPGAAAAFREPDKMLLFFFPLLDRRRLLHRAGSSYPDVLSFVFDGGEQGRQRETPPPLAHACTSAMISGRVAPEPPRMRAALSMKGDSNAMMDFSFSEHLS